MKVIWDSEEKRDFLLYFKMLYWFREGFKKYNTNIKI
jgi:hypothetical protein